MKLKNNLKISISCDGGAASGKTTGARLIARKYNLNFLSSGLLYRYACYLLIKNHPKNRIRFLKKKFKTLKYKKISRIKLQSEKINFLVSKIAKEKKISSVYFDRGGYKYHGRIKALADSLRKNGLKI